MMARSTYSSLFTAVLAWSLCCLAASQSTICYDGWQEHKGACYRSFTEWINWDQAQSFCDREGAYLAEPNEYELTNTALKWALKANNVNCAWLGITRKDRPAYQLASTGEQLNYRPNWGRGEPNNLGGTERCATICAGGNNPFWNDYVCEYGLPFICEYKRMVTEQPPY